MLTRHSRVPVRRAPAVAAALGAVALAAAGVEAQRPSPLADVITAAGGAVSIPAAVEGPRQGARVLFDIVDGDAARALARPARLLQLYAMAGLDPRADVRVAVVFHGKATAAALSDEARAAAGRGAGDARPLIRALADAGVEIYVCGQSMAAQGFTAAQIAPEVRVAVSAMNVVVNKQGDGYVLVP